MTCFLFPTSLQHHIIFSLGCFSSWSVYCGSTKQYKQCMLSKLLLMVANASTRDVHHFLCHPKKAKNAASQAAHRSATQRVTLS